ncbi:MAG: hypothetical protein VX463_20235 [Pseudomonadota bacterium]|nr:hypothetical protein [Pseudomonadota bacterium]
MPAFPALRAAILALLALAAAAPGAARAGSSFSSDFNVVGTIAAVGSPEISGTLTASPDPSPAVRVDPTAFLDAHLTGLIDGGSWPGAHAFDADGLDFQLSIGVVGSVEEGAVGHRRRTGAATRVFDIVNAGAEAAFFDIGISPQVAASAEVGDQRFPSEIFGRARSRTRYAMTFDPVFDISVPPSSLEVSAEAVFVTRAAFVLFDGDAESRSETVSFSLPGGASGAVVITVLTEGYATAFIPLPASGLPLAAALAALAGAAGRRRVGGWLGGGSIRHQIDTASSCGRHPGAERVLRMLIIGRPPECSRPSPHRSFRGRFSA